MAESKDILKVKDAIEDEASANGWGDVEIAARLDAGQSVLRVIETYWTKRAQAYLLVVSTSESGSTRGNDVIYNRMVAEAERYRVLAVAEEAASAPVVSSASRLGSFGIRRV